MKCFEGPPVAVLYLPVACTNRQLDCLATQLNYVFYLQYCCKFQEQDTHHSGHVDVGLGGDQIAQGVQQISLASLSHPCEVQ